MDVDLSRHQRLQDFGEWLAGLRQLDTQDIGLGECVAAERENLFGMIDMIHHETCHGKVDRIDQTQTRHPQVVPLQLAEQFMQLADAILHEHAKLMQAGPIHPAHRLRLNGVIIVTKFARHPFHSLRIRGSVRTTRDVLQAR